MASKLVVSLARFWGSVCARTANALVMLHFARNGRVWLADFYAASHVGGWHFRVSEAYLKGSECWVYRSVLLFWWQHRGVRMGCARQGVRWCRVRLPRWVQAVSWRPAACSVHGRSCLRSLQLEAVVGAAGVCGGSQSTGASPCGGSAWALVVVRRLASSASL